VPVSEDKSWRRRSTRYLYQSQWFNLRADDLTLPSGEEVTYTLVEHPGYAVIVPLLDDGRVVMEQVYRHTLGRNLLECPSGGLDGEAPEVAARRELEEETGYRAKRWDSLGSYYGRSGISDERFHLFLARDLTEDGTIALEATEQIEIERIPLTDLVARALRGEVEDAPSALGVLLAERLLREN
jgi:ADP-ribose pyrophosphatase